MKLIRSLHNISHLTQSWKDCVATIGNFDGLHKGHQNMLDRVVAAKRAFNCPAVVILFEPQPREYFKSSSPPVRLMRLTEKYIALQAYPIDFVFCLYFNRELADMSAEQFIQIILLNTLNIKHLIIGADFRFGYKRVGDVSLLKAYSKRSDFTVDAMPIQCLGGEKISSTRLRRLLSEGQLNEASLLLGRPYSCIGRVVQGDQRGRAIGFPTANIRLHRPFVLGGVYAVTVQDLTQPDISKPFWQGVANVGCRPTVDGQSHWLEVHLFDVDKMIYGHRLKVMFWSKLRDEKAFDSLGALVSQIQSDVQASKAYFFEVLLP